MQNTLALIDAILKAAREHNAEGILMKDLLKLGLHVGLTADQLEDALNSDRMLVIYEP